MSIIALNLFIAILSDTFQRSAAQVSKYLIKIVVTLQKLPSQKNAKKN